MPRLLCFNGQQISNDDCLESDRFDFDANETCDVSDEFATRVKVNKGSLFITRAYFRKVVYICAALMSGLVNF